MIELNGIQISDNNINTKKNVKIYVDEKQLGSKVGELSDLKTTDKSSIVNAINEVKDTTDTLQVNVNRIYSEFTIIPNTSTEQEFTYKQSNEDVIEKGVAMIDKVKGNSVVWNQIIAKPYTFGETRDYTFSTWYNGGSRSINDKGQFIFITNGGTTGVGNSLSITPKNTHKYLLSYKVKANIASVCTVYKNTTSNVIANIAEADKWYFVSYIGSNDDTNNYSSFLNAVVAANSPETTVTIDDAQVIDLTQMFGAGNEPSSVKEFLSRKPKVADEYTYNEGTIVNNKVEKVATTGRNLWDEEWELGAYNASTGEKIASSNQIRSKNMFACLPNTSYYWRIPNKANGSYMGHCLFYDISRAFISSLPVGPNSYLTVTTPSNARFIAFNLCNEYGTTYNHDICINFSDPAINGQYFPYEKHELDLSWVKEIKDTEGVKLFENGLKSAGTAFDEIRKNKAVKRLGSVDLGTLPWNTSWWDGDGRLYTYLDNKKVGRKNIVYPLGPTYEFDGVLINTIGICGNSSNNYIYVGDAKTHSSASEFISSLSGVYAYYELAEPIEVEYDEKNLTYPVVAGGTEEAIASEPSTPMRASITYGSNTVATILSLMNRVNELERKIIN